jgi:hypothetical protein
MRYTVTWTPSARDIELTEIWLQALDRQAVTKASHEIDRRLRIDPESQGQDFYGDRILEVWPLIVVFAVYPDDRLVEVLQVRHV